MSVKEAKFKFYQDKKNSRRFKSEDEEFPIRDVYVMRPWADKRESFVLTISTQTTPDAS